MKQEHLYDCIILGGGLAGLSLAILLAQKKRSVLLIEKKVYPHHKVCGEYVSMESYDFLCRLGLPLQALDLPFINTLLLTADSSAEVKEQLDLGGFGISRYKLEFLLSELAVSSGVDLKTHTIAHNYIHEAGEFTVSTNQGVFRAKQVCASFGKHAFGNFYKTPHLSENWVGIKYHIHFSAPVNQIALHNFKGGYCGISRIEESTYCLCYLTKASELNKYGNNISRFEQAVLRKNKYLDTIFQEAKFLFDKPVTVSNVTFDVKKAVCDHVFYLGDAAGTIAPLSGNGMSNALRASYLLSIQLERFYNEQISQQQLEAEYTIQWNRHFRKRILAGKMLQYFFCKHILTTFFIWFVKTFKPLRKIILRQTHGMPF